MERSEILKTVTEVVADSLGLDQGEIQTESDFTDDLGTDSLDRVELIMRLEEKFGLDIPDEEAEKLTTIEKVVSFLEKNGV